MHAEVLLSIAGFDPSSGAGYTADLQTFQAHGFFGTAAQTALTVQSTRGVEAVYPTPATQLAAQLRCLDEDLAAAGIKLGMLGSAENIRAVSAFLGNRKQHGACPVVLDPVLVSSSGAALLEPAAVQTLLAALLPLVTVATPNRAELACLTGLPACTREEIERAAAHFGRKFPRLGLVVTGGDAEAPDDLILEPNGQPEWMQGTRIPGRATHGTGCAFSSALLCGLVRGQSLPVAAAAAKRFVEQAILTARPFGSGKGPMNLLWPLTRREG